MLGRIRALIVLVAAASLAPGVARAEDAATEACLAAHTDGQKARRDGRLLEARRSFLTCAAASCPDLVKQQCVPWLADIEARIPSVVLDVRDESGRDLGDVRVSVDGTQRLERLDGRRMPLDPGMHTFRFEARGHRTVERSFVLAPLADLVPGLAPPGWQMEVATALQHAREREGTDAVRPVAAWDAPAARWVPFDEAGSLTHGAEG